MNYLKSKKSNITYIKIIIIVLLILIPVIQINFSFTNAATQEEAFDEIIAAFEKVQQLSQEGVDVDDLINDLNTALNLFEQGNYNEAYDKAAEVLETAEQILSDIRWGQIFPYVLIPINLVIIAAVIVFFGRNMLGWFRRKRDEEFMELEIVYEPKEVEIKEENDKKEKGETNVKK